MILLIVILTAFLGLFLVVLASWLLVRKTRGVPLQRERDALRKELLRDIPPLLFAEPSSPDLHSRQLWQKAVTPDIGKIHALFRSGGRRRRRFVRDVAREVLGELNEAVIGETQHRIGYLFERLGFVEEEISRLADRRWWVRGEAAHRLGVTRSRLGVLPLVHLLQDPEREVRSAATQSLIDIAGVKGALHSILQSLTAITPWMEVLLGKRILAEGAASIGPLLAGLDSPSGSVRRFSITMLGELRAQEALAPLFARLPDLDPASKDLALVTLGKCGDERALELLEKSVDAESEQTCCAALTGLGYLGAPSTVPLLTRTLTDPRLPVRRAAGEALTKILPAGKIALAEVARRGEGETRMVASHYLELLALQEEGE